LRGPIIVPRETTFQVSTIIGTLPDFDVLNNAIRRLIDNEELWRWLD